MAEKARFAATVNIDAERLSVVPVASIGFDGLILEGLSGVRRTFGVLTNAAGAVIDALRQSGSATEVSGTLVSGRRGKISVIDSVGGQIIEGSEGT